MEWRKGKGPGTFEHGEARQRRLKGEVDKEQAQGMCCPEPGMCRFYRGRGHHLQSDA